jgi:hypothetical protein
MGIAALEEELERLYKIIESSEVESEIDDAHKQISEFDRRLSNLLIKQARENGQQFVEPLKPAEADLLAGWDGNCPGLSQITLGDGKSLILRLRGINREQDVVIEFERVRFFSLGEPRFDGLTNHELWQRGLSPLIAGRIVNSKKIAELDKLDPDMASKESSHYIFSFHDETFECIAAGFRAAVGANS